MSVSLIELTYLTTGLVLGAAAAWMARRPALARMRSQLDSDRVLHAERLKTYGEAEARFRDAFASLSAQALNKNNETFLHLAETRLRQARTEATADIDARKKAITRFDLVAIGDYWGGDYEGGRFKRPGRTPLGISFELVRSDSAVDRAPPLVHMDRAQEHRAYFAAEKKR